MSKDIRKTFCVIPGRSANTQQERSQSEQALARVCTKFAIGGEPVLYQLMNKDVVVATYREKKGLVDYNYEEIEQLDAYIPYGFIGINDWIDGRQIAKHRSSIEKPYA